MNAADLLWMGECPKDHKISSEDDLIDGQCRVCYRSKKKQYSSPRRRNFTLLRWNPEWWGR